MRLRHVRISRGAVVASLALAAWVSAATSAPAQDTRVRKGAAKAAAKDSASKERERASGVILKVEPASAKSKRRLTINTNDFWRDWARDQSQVKDTGTPRKDAARGKNSVATVGEPVDPDSLVVVEVGSDTKVETRFRAVDDETSAGTKAPESAKGESNTKAVHFGADDLKPGLFVEVNFRTKKAVNTATTVSVIRPIGGPDSGSADKPK